MTGHHLFLSYCRSDNRPVNDCGEGWVTAFERELQARHRRYSGRELRVFFDQKAIDTSRDWRRELGAGLRSSRLFLAFLTPNYLTSPNCLWEWDEYLRREHSAARGDDGLTPVFFITPADLRPREDQAIAAWLAAVAEKYPWFSPGARTLSADDERRARSFLTDLHRRNKTPCCELQPWIGRGPDILRELDAAERSLEAKTAPRDPAADLRTLAERLDALDCHIAHRLDRIALADLAPGNIPRGHEHFVGRHKELRDLHDIMLTGGPQCGGRGMGGRGMIAATFSPGGLGKTALARQYAHAYAEFYAAGGTWEVPCEGATALGAVLLRLADDRAFQRLGREVGEPLALSDAERADFPRAAAAVIDYLCAVTTKRVALLKEKLCQHPDRHCALADVPEIEQPRALLILDNVDRPELLSAAQTALLPAEEWLEIIVTTRLNPGTFGGGHRTFAHLEVGVLPPADAFQLLADFQPGQRFASQDEEEAAREIVNALGGWTLALELVAAFLGDEARNHVPDPARRFLAQLEKEGLAWVDDLAEMGPAHQQQRHREERRENRIGTLVRWSLDRLSPPARTALEFASLLMPDEIPLDWLRQLTAARHPVVDDDTALDHPHAWPRLWAELRALRLLHPALDIEVDNRRLEIIPAAARIHRLVAAHVQGAPPSTPPGEAPPLPAHFAELDAFTDQLTTDLEQQFGQVDAATDARWQAEHPWLRDQLDFLLSARPPTPSLLRSAQVAADFEGQHGSLARALDLTQRILAAKEALLAANPGSAQAARDVSVSLNKLGDFLASRGQPGDAEAALGHFQRCHDVLEALLEANPGSAQAARDLSVSLERLAAAMGGRAGGETQALELQARSLELALKLREQNPSSWFYQRTAAVSFFLTFQRARAAGNEALAGQCLAGCFSVLDPLVRAGVDLDPPMRRLHAQLAPLFTQG